jgi:N-methylhydantoinase A/oxoprolinase/acetone carboxylase beta subunit
VAAIRQAGVNKVALVGIFSPLDHQGIHEDACKAMMLEEDPSLSIVCSHAIGGVGLLERENATILNASILDLARKTVSAFCLAIVELRLSCPLYLTQNDGTLTDAVTAAELPIQTFASGPTNSMTGAAFLASLDRPGAIDSSERQVLVVDIGGTTLDVCALLPSGFPRQAPNFVEIGGVRTAFSMPEVLSLGLGGGSIVRHDGATGHTTVGPDSVGHLLTEKAIAFGGDVMTATDIAVATGTCQLGDPARAKGISSEVLSGARKAIGKILERAVEGMKVSSLPVTVLLVGGGSIIHMGSLQGVSECIIPPHHDSANAVGAAIAKVAGTVDVIEILDNQDERTVLKRAEQAAIEAAVKRGADRDSVKIAEVEKLPLQYVMNKATRIKVKAIGDLGHSSEERGQHEWQNPFSLGDTHAEEEEKATGHEDTEKSDTKHSIYLDIPAYKPEVRNGVWYVSAVDLEFIASGTGVLGTGGGGSPYLQYLIDLQVLKEAAAGKMRVVSPATLDDTAVCVMTGWYGAPSAGIERLPSGTEMGQAVEGSLKIAGLTKLDAVLAGEIGGANGLASFPTAVHFDVPVLDGDLMGRAYPSIEHGNGPNTLWPEGF